MPAGRMYVSSVSQRQNTYGKKYKRKPTVKKLDRKIAKIQEDQEVCHLNTQLLAVPFASDPGTGNIILLNGLTQGDTINTRDKDSARITSLHLKGTILFPSQALVDAALPASQSIARLIIVWDKQSNGAAPIGTQLLDPLILATAPEYPYRQYNRDNVPDRFKILHDKTYTMPYGAVATTNVATGAVTAWLEPVKIINKTIRINRKTNYGLGVTGTISDIVRGSIYMFCIGESLNVLENPTFKGGCRIYFKDT